MLIRAPRSLGGASRFSDKAPQLAWPLMPRRHSRLRLEQLALLGSEVAVAQRSPSLLQELADIRLHLLQPHPLCWLLEQRGSSLHGFKEKKRKLLVRFWAAIPPERSDAPSESSHLPAASVWCCTEGAMSCVTSCNWLSPAFAVNHRKWQPFLTSQQCPCVRPCRHCTQILITLLLIQRVLV